MNNARQAEPGHPGALVGEFTPGTSVLHRLPPGPKLAGVALFGVLVVSTRSMPASWVFLALACGLAAGGHVRPTKLARAARSILLIAVVIAGFQWWLFGPSKAIETVVDLIALAVVGITFTATTSPTHMLDRVKAWVRPLSIIGVHPERVALTMSLAMQAIPTSIQLAQETRDAARARGLDRNMRAHISPFVIRTVARAHETGDALAARGLGDD
jgi:biotin transport system permease protein